MSDRRTVYASSPQGSFSPAQWENPHAPYSSSYSSSQPSAYQSSSAFGTSHPPSSGGGYPSAQSHYVDYPLATGSSPIHDGYNGYPPRSASTPRSASSAMSYHTYPDVSQPISISRHGHAGAHPYARQPSISPSAYQSPQPFAPSSPHSPQSPTSPLSQYSYQPGDSPQYPASPQRPFACDKCALSFSRQHDLKRHRDTHSGEKPFFCNGGCGKQFTRKDALKRHQLVKRCGTEDTT